MSLQLTIQESLDRKKFWPRNHPEQIISEQKLVVGESRDPNKANRTKVRQIAKFSKIVYYKIVINNLI